MPVKPPTPKLPKNLDGPLESFDLPGWMTWALLTAASLIVVIAGWSYIWKSGAPYGDDNSSHIALMLQIAHLFRGGHTDLFLDQVNLGVPLFLSYQPLPGLLTGALAALALCCQSPLWIYKIFVVGLWALMPWSWYVGARWLGLHRVAALAIGLLVLGIRAPVNVGLTFESIAYKGLFTQSFGILFLPLALGSWYRYLHIEKGRWTNPVFWLTLTFLSHAFFGLYACIGTACMLLLTHEDAGPRILRAAAMYLAVFALIAWWVVPLLEHKTLIGGLPWKTAAQNGWSWTELRQLFLDRALFDHERFSWFTILMGVGAWGLWRKRNDFLFAGWWVALSFVTTILLLGRTNLGRYYSWIPLHGELNVLRYLNGLHVCGLLLAGLGVYHLSVVIYGLVQKQWSPSIASVVLGLCITCASGAYLHNTYAHMQHSLKLFDHKDPAYRRVIRKLAHDKRARFVVAKRLGTGSHFHRDLLPALARRPQLQSYGMSFHATYATYFIEYFDFKPNSYSLYNVRHVVSKVKNPVIPMKGLKLVSSAPPYYVFESKAAKGYFSLIRLPVTVYGAHKKNKMNLRRLIPLLYARGALPRLVIKSAEPAPGETSLAPSAYGSMAQQLQGRKTNLPIGQFVQKALQKSPRPTGKVWTQSHNMTSYKARVEVKMPSSWLLLRVNYFPYWHATIDGKPADIAHVGPNFMAVEVPVGVHNVRFSYRNPQWQKWGFLFSFLAMMGLAGWLLWPWFWRGVGAIKDWRQARREPSVPPLVK